MMDDYDHLDDAFQQLEQKQAMRLIDSLVDISDRIYALPLKSSQSVAALASPPPIKLHLQQEGHPVIVTYPRYYSEGYDATHDSVDDRELFQWRNNFHWLRVESVGAALPCNKEPAAVDVEMLATARTCAEDEWYVDNIVSQDPIDGFDPKECLAIVGKCCTLHPVELRLQISPTDEDFRDSSISNGILEEYFDYNDEDLGRHDLVASTSKLKCKKASPTLYVPSDSVSPYTSIKEEVVASLVDMLWPDVAYALKPIVQKVLAVAQENCVPADNFIKSDELLLSESDWNRDDGDGFLFTEGGNVDISW